MRTVVAAVLVSASAPALACTAVVVSPTAVITAAHCVDHPGFQFGVFFGADASPYPITFAAA